MRLFGGSKDAVHLANPPAIGIHVLTEPVSTMAMQVRDFAVVPVAAVFNGLQPVSGQTYTGGALTTETFGS